jgi:hypothetical protein
MTDARRPYITSASRFVLVCSSPRHLGRASQFYFLGVFIFSSHTIDRATKQDEETYRDHTMMKEFRIILF